MATQKINKKNNSKLNSCVSHPIAAYIGVNKINFKRPPSLKESVDITFIETGPVVFKSINY